jgi:hypothetical protein
MVCGFWLTAALAGYPCATAKGQPSLATASACLSMASNNFTCSETGTTQLNMASPPPHPPACARTLFRQHWGV